MRRESMKIEVLCADDYMIYQEINLKNSVLGKEEEIIFIRLLTCEFLRVH